MGKIYKKIVVCFVLLFFAWLFPATVGTIAFEQDIYKSDTTIFVNAEEEAAELIQKAERFASEGRWNSALSLYNKAMTTFGDRLFPAALDTRRFIGVREYCIKKMSEAPLAELSAYRQDSGMDMNAGRLFEETKKTKDTHTLKKISTIYFISSYGDNALDLLGDLYFESGQMRMAILSWTKLLNSHPDADIDIPTTQLKLVAAKIFIFPDKADEIIRSFPARYRDAVCSLAGKKITARDFLKNVSTQIRHIRKTTPENVVEVGIDRPLNVWNIDFITKGLRDQVRSNLLGQYSRQGLNIGYIETLVEQNLTRHMLASRPLIHNGKLLFTATGILHETDLETGISTKISDAPFNYYYNRPPQKPTARVENGKYLYPSYHSKILAIDLRAKKYIQATTAPADAEFFHAISFISAPVLRDNLFYVVCEKSDNGSVVYLCAFDATSGVLKQKMFLCSKSNPRFQPSGPAQPEAQLLESEGLLYVLTNAGMVGCIDFLNWSPLWATTYSTVSPTSTLTQGNPLIIQNGVMIIAPEDSRFIYTIEASSGRMLWEPKGDPSFRYILGVKDSTVYLSGEKVAGFDLVTGTKKWESSFEDNNFSGRGIFAGNKIYHPTESMLAEIDVTSGKVTRITKWNSSRKGQSDIILGNKQIIRYSSLKIEAFLDRKQQAALRDTLEKDPENIKAYLQIGEIYRLQNLGELAEKKLILGYNLARAKNSPLLKAFEDRLFSLFMKNAELADTDPAKIRHYISAMSFTSSEARILRIRLKLAEAYEKMREWQKSIDEYQMIIRDSSHLFVNIEGLNSPSAQYASRQIDRIMEKVTRTPYEKHEAMAKALLENGIRQKTTLPLERIVIYYPNSTHVPEALEQMGQILADSGDNKSAANAWQLLLKKLDNGKDKNLRLKVLSKLYFCYKAISAHAAQRSLLAELGKNYAAEIIPNDENRRTGMVFAKDEIKAMPAVKAFAGKSDSIETRFPVARKWSIPLEKNQPASFIQPTGEASAAMRDVAFIYRGRGVTEFRDAKTGELLRSSKTLKRAYIGIHPSPPDCVQIGVQVSSVIKNTPAEKAGIEPGDTIIAFNEKPVITLDNLRKFCNITGPENKCTLKILKKGDVKKVELTLTDKITGVSLGSGGYVNHAFFSGDNIVTIGWPESISYDTNGQVAWRVPTYHMGSITGASHNASGHVAIMTSDKHLTLLDSNTGTQIWSVKTSLNGGNLVKPTFIDNTIIIAQRYPLQFSAYDLVSGRLVYSRKVARTGGGSPPLKVGKTFVFLGGESQNKMLAYDLTSGNKIWEYEFPQHIYNYQMIAGNEKYIFVMPWQNKIALLSTDNGMAIRETALPIIERVYYQNCAIDNEHVYILYQKIDPQLNRPQQRVMCMKLPGMETVWDAAPPIEGYPQMILTREKVIVLTSGRIGTQTATILDKDNGRVSGIIGDNPIAVDGNDLASKNIRRLFFMPYGVVAQTDNQFIFYTTIKP